MGQGIWIVEEHDTDGTKNITLELLSEGQKLARKLKEELCVCLLGHQVEGYIPRLAQHGAEKVYLLNDALLSEYDLDTYGLIMGKLIEEYEPSIIMMGATPMGSELGPRIAARLRLPCITDVKKIAGNKRNLKITKSVYNDQLYADIKPAEKRPLIMTLPPGETDIAKSDKTNDVQVITKDLGLSADIKRTEYKRFIKGDPRTIRVDEADLIVAVGNGVKADVLPTVQELADLLGATIGGTRVAVDNGLIPFERQIGITGKLVLPKMLFALGISGAYEFTDGMKDAKFIMAANKDGKARIFDFANLGLKGDLNEIVPAIIDKLRSIQKKEKETEENN